MAPARTASTKGRAGLERRTVARARSAPDTASTPLPHWGSADAQEAAPGGDSPGAAIKAETPPRSGLCRALMKTSLIRRVQRKRRIDYRRGGLARAPRALAKKAGDPLAEGRAGCRHCGAGARRSVGRRRPPLRRGRARGPCSQEPTAQTALGARIGRHDKHRTHTRGTYSGEEVHDIGVEDVSWRARPRAGICRPRGLSIIQYRQQAFRIRGRGGVSSPTRQQRIVPVSYCKRHRMQQNRK